MKTKYENTIPEKKSSNSRNLATIYKMRFYTMLFTLIRVKTRYLIITRFLCKYFHRERKTI